MTEKTIVKLIKKLEVTDLNGEKVMIDFSTGKYFMLQGSANDIWDMIQDNITVEGIKSELMNRYEVDEKTCLDAIIEFVDQLKKYEFIELV